MIQSKIDFYEDRNLKRNLIRLLWNFSKKTGLKIFVPVGHTWKFDLEKTLSLDFRVKSNFSKIRFEHVMPKFLATTENTRKIGSEESNYKRGKVVKNSSGKFPIHNSNEIRAVLFSAEDGK